MTRINRDQFRNEFQNGIDINSLSDETKTALANAGISKSKLDEIAHDDGKIEGAEVQQLFDAIDTFDNEQLDGHIDTEMSIAGGMIAAHTAEGEAYRALKIELERNVTKARLQGLSDDGTNQHDYKKGFDVNSKKEKPEAFQNSEGFVAEYWDLPNFHSKSKNQDPQLYIPMVSMGGWGSFKFTNVQNPNFVQDVLASSPKVPTSNEYAKYITATRKALAHDKLPTSAEGVRVVVMAEDDDAHAAAIVRTIAGKQTGLARGADLKVATPTKSEQELLKSHPRYSEYDAIGKKVAAQTETIQDLGKAGAIEADVAMDFMRETLKGIRETNPKDGKTTVATLSRGDSPRLLAEKLAENVSFNSPAGQEAIQVFQSDNGVVFNANNPQHVNTAKEILIRRIAGAVQSELQSQGQTDSKKALQKEVLDARKEGIIIFNAAGNDYKVTPGILNISPITPLDPTTSASIMDDVNGLVTVGNVNINKANNKNDDVMALESSDGKIEIAAPGTDLPIGKNGKKYDLASGTSFSAPYAAAVAALMIKANPNITPDEIETYMSTTANDIPGTTLDGAGMIDAVKAVDFANSLAT